MIFHTLYSMPINRCSTMLISGRQRLLLRYPVPIPRRTLKKQFKVFKEMYSLEFNEKAVLSLQRKELIIMIYRNRITQLQALYYMLILTFDQYSRSEFKAMFGKEPKSAKDGERVLKEIKKVESKLKIEQMVKTPGDEGEEESFESIIASVEIILGYHIDRRMKLYQFKYQYILALKKAKETKKFNDGRR